MISLKELKEIRENKIECLFIFIAFFNIFHPILPPAMFAVFSVAVMLWRLNLIGSFYLCSYMVPILLGTALYTYGVVGVASILQYLLLIICLYKWKKGVIRLDGFRSHANKLLLLLCFFTLSAILSSGGQYAFIKVKETIIMGLFCFFSYAFIFSNLEKTNLIRIGLYCILFSLLLLGLGPLLSHGEGPANLLDFGYLRKWNTLVGDEDSFLVDYQHVGFFAVLGCGIIMMGNLKQNTSSIFLMACMALTTVISLYSGARQFMIISALLILIWALTQNKLKLGLAVPILGVAIVLYFLSFLFSEGGLLGSVTEEGYLEASNRDMCLLKGVTDFMSNPVFGIGYGRFEFFGRYGLYPHNMIVEILAETGIVGFFTILLLSYRQTFEIIKRKKWFLALLTIYFFRSMASGGLDSNIMLFSFIFATNYISIAYKYNNE